MSTPKIPSSSSSATPSRIAKEAALEDYAWEESILTSADVLKKSIPWDRLASGGVIEAKELPWITRLLNQSGEAQWKLLEDSPDAYGTLLLSLVGKLAQLEHLQYVLALIDTLLIQKESLVSIFLNLHKHQEGLPFDPFLNHLRREGGDWFVNTRASNILGFLLLKATRYGVPSERVTVVTSALMKWFAVHLESAEKPEVANPLLLSLRNILRSQDARVCFDSFGGIEVFGPLLRSPHHPVIYNAMFCLWLLSYNVDLVRRSFPKSSIVPKIVETLKTVHREKIIRISIATLCNLAEGNRENSLHIIEGGFMKLLPNFLLRKWGDNELEGNLAALDENLQKMMSELGSWDMYKAEVLSGNLEWTLVHKNDRFWRENASKFSENNFQMVGVLVNIISVSENPLVLAVALNDIGRFVRFHPAGRAAVQAIPQAKMAIMAKLNHSDAEVQKQALLAIQKLMVSNWEFLSS